MAPLSRPRGEATQVTDQAGRPLSKQKPLAHRRQNTENTANTPNEKKEVKGP